MGTTWNPSDKTSDMVLSNGNLTVATNLNNGTHGGARGTTGKSSGKWMLQFTGVTLNTSDQLDYVGIGTLADTLGLAQGSQDQVILIANGTAYSGDGTSAFNWLDFSNLPASCTVDLCVDMGAQLFWFRINGGSWNNSGTADPAAGTGGHPIKATGTKFPYVRLTNTPNAATLNPVPASPPAGFLTWDVALKPTASAQIVG